MIPQSEFKNPGYEERITFVRETLELSESVPIELSPIEGRGSDRTFFRLKWNRNDSAILIDYDPRRVENTYYAGVAAFLRHIDVPVPRMIRHDPVRCLILMEDLGERDLFSLREVPWKTRQDLYQKTLAIVHRLHSFPERDFPSGQVRLMEGFGPDLYRWERDYFKENFIKAFCGIELEPSFEREIEEELSGLAERLSTTRRSLVHRDLQSQNVMVRGGEPFLIDFQGMRFGSPFYDLGSLLCDPYVEFGDDQRMELLLYYYGLSKRGLTWKEFQKIFWEASAQRLMQALGAYGFLGLRKGLKTYLDHIPSGLRNLHLATGHAGSLPCLWQLCAACEKAIERRS
ncbi:MAG: phosphotransferase [Syntrophaceae bacterium]|nr:phosphotransferase [Syntrophaceae bacterium]